MPYTVSCCMFTVFHQVLSLIIVQFRSDGNAPIHVQAIITLPLLMDNVARRICNIVQLFLNLVRLLNVNNAEFDENLVVMLIDDISNPGVDLLIMSDEFRRRDIVWVIIALRTGVSQNWNLYRTLTRDTGGDLMLIGNAAHILAHVVRSAVFGEYTLRQAFLHVNIGANGQNLLLNALVVTDDTDETDGVGDLSFDHGSSE